MKLKAMSLALVSLMASGVNAAETAQTKAVEAKKIAILKKKKNRGADMTTTSRGAPLPLTKKQEVQDNLPSSSSSATTTSMPGITAGTSATNTETLGTKKTFVDNIRASAVLEFYGASVTDPFSGYKPDLVNGYSRGNDGIEVLEHFMLGYDVSDNINLSLNPYFQTVGQSYDGKSESASFRFRENFSYVNVKFKRIIKTKKFTYNGGVRLYPEMGGLTKGRPLYVRHDMNLVYNLTSRVNLAMYNTVRFYDRNSVVYDKDPSAFDGRVTLGPTVEYQIADSLGSYLSYVADIRHTKSTGKLTDAPKDEAPYIELGGAWDISKRVNLNPYIDAYTNAFTPEAFQIGANLAFSIL